MYSDAEMFLIMTYSDEILTLCDEQEALTRSDLQGAAMAIIMNVVLKMRALNKEDYVK
jgi:hypothetical protein